MQLSLGKKSATCHPIKTHQLRTFTKIWYSLHTHSESLILLGNRYRKYNKFLCSSEMYSDMCAIVVKPPSLVGNADPSSSPWKRVSIVGAHVACLITAATPVHAFWSAKWSIVRHSSYESPIVFASNIIMSRIQRRNHPIKLEIFLS